MSFDPDVFLLGDTPAQTTAFNPDAFLAETENRPADTALPIDNTVTPPSARQEAIARKQADLGRELTNAEYTSLNAELAQNEAASRGDIAGAMKLSRSRSELDVSARDQKTAESEVAAVRAPYLAVRGTMGGVTLGASDIVLRKVEEKALGESVQAQSMGESAGENVGRLLGSIFTGARIAGGGAKINATGKLVKASELSGGLTSLISKTGARPIAQLIATRAATSLATMAPQEAASVINGDKPIPDAIRDTAINALSSIVGIGPEIFVKPGVANFLAQVTGQVAVDAAADAMLTGRLTKENAGEWMINELPNIATAAIFGAKDLTDADFAVHQGKYKKDFVDLFTRKVKTQAAKPITQYGPDVEATGAEAALKMYEAKTIKDNYPLDTPERVQTAITDLNLKPELQALHNEIEGIMLELKGGDRIAGRIPVKNERGEITGWTNTGAAYPGGLGADTLPAIRNYLEGKPLTANQETQLAKATKYALEKLSSEVGFDVANQTHVANEEMAVGDQVKLDGERYTVKELDPDTGNITLKDGKLVTLKAGETVLADRGSHLDAEGKPAGQLQGETDSAPFDPDAFLAGEAQPAKVEPVRQQIGDLTAEKAADGNWDIVGTDGRRTRLDPTAAEDHALIQQIDPDARAAEVKRIATETAEKLPGAKINFVENEAQMGEIRAKYGKSVKDIKAEDGTVRGFAVVGSNEYYIMTRNMRPDQAARTVIHEAAGHIGIRGVLGDQVDTVMDGIFSSRAEHSATIKKIAERYKLDLTTQEGRREATEELLAHVAERRQQDPGAWKRLVAKIKDTFRQMGFEWAQKWTDNDVLMLIQRGKERVSRPEQARELDPSGIRLKKAHENKDQMELLFHETPAVEEPKPTHDTSLTPEPVKNNPGEIHDFGEKIGGARKDYASKMEHARNLDISKHPFSEVWPEPDYQNMIKTGIDPWTVGWIRSARDEIPAKPRQSYKLSRYVEMVKLFREMAERLISGRYTKEFAQEMLNRPEYSMVKNHVGSRAELYQELGHDISLKGITLQKNHYTVYHGQDNVTKWQVERKNVTANMFNNMPHELGVGNTREEAIASFKNQLANLQSAPQQTKPNDFFKIYSYRDPGKKGYVIGKKMAAGYADLYKFDTPTEARTFLKEHYDEVQARYESFRKIGNERRETNSPRIGDDHRNGRDATPEMFQNAYGFRGVEFGNYVEQSKRQSDLNRAFDALSDLAAVLNVPTKALSLNGELGLAFGARGHGGKNAPAAHYEHEKVVINLTKENGAGSLAHEFWHALDSYFSRMSGEKFAMATEDLRTKLASRGSKFINNSPMRNEMFQAFGNILKTTMESGMPSRANELDARRSSRYWSETREMTARAFENYVIERLKAQGAANDYLANINDAKSFSSDMLDSLLSGKTAMDSYPYLTESEVAPFTAAFDNFFSTVKTKDTDRGVMMFKKGDSGLTKADQDMLNKSLKARLYGRPDLSQITTSKQTRGLVADVDQARNEAGEPTPQSAKIWTENADTRIQKDITGEWLNVLSGKLHFEGDDAGQNTIIARKLFETKGLEAFAGGDDAEIAKVGAAMWGFRNTRSNLARALTAGRDFLETPAERNRRWIAESLYYPGAKVDSKLKGMDLKSMQAELQKRAGKMQEIRTKLLDMGIDLAKLDEKILNDPAQMAEIVRQIQISNAGIGDMAYEYWRNAILSAPPTHAANILGNTLSTTWNYTAQKGTEALINSLTGSNTGTTFKELPGMYRALWGARQQAARNAMTAFSTEQGSIEGLRLNDKGVAIPGKTGRVIRTPQRALLAADEFSKTMIIQAELYSRAYQEAYAKGWRGPDLDKRITQILADPKSDMMSAAIDEAKYLTFQAEPGEITSWVMKSRSIPGLQWVSKFVLPFVSTPTNIVKMGVRKTPLGLIRMAKEAAQGNYKGNRNALVRDSAEQMLAAAGVFALISMVNDEDQDGNPRITGSGPSGGKDAGKQQAEQRQHPAQSIRLGGRWYSYARVEPLATAITHTVDIIQAIKNKPGEDSADQMGRVWSSIKSLARDKTFLSTIGDIIRATEDDSKGISIVQNFASSWIPNIIRSGARASDPYYRSAKLMTRDDKGVAGELASNIGQAALPIAAIQDAPRMDYWGRPMAKSEGFGPATDIIWRLVSPITVQHTHAPDNFDRMLFNYNRKAEQKGWEKFWPAMPNNAFELPGARGIERTARMDPDEYSRFLKRRGDFFFTMAAGTQWKFDDPSTMEVALFKKFMAKATQLAKNDILQERKLNPVLKALKQTKEDQRPRPQLKPIPTTRPMMNLDSDRRSL